MQRIYSLLSIVISLKQEVSKHNQLLSLFLSFCLTNLCPHFQIFWVVEAHKIQDTTHTKSYMRTKSARQTPVKASCYVRTDIIAVELLLAASFLVQFPLQFLFLLS